MKKGRCGRDRDGLWVQEPNEQTQKQIDAGLLVKEADTRGGYRLVPQTLEASLLTAIKSRKRTKKDVATSLKLRIGKCSGKKEKDQLMALLAKVQNTLVRDTEAE